MQNQVYVVCKNFGTPNIMFYASSDWSREKVDMFDTPEEANSVLLDYTDDTSVSVEKFVKPDRSKMN